MSRIIVEVAYALPKQQWLRSLDLAQGATAAEAIAASGVLAQFPQIDLSRQAIGIFGRIIRPEHRLQSGDRVEIYRALIIDPKSARRLRAKNTEPIKAG